MKIYQPVVNSTPSMRVYTNKAAAEAAMKRIYKKEIKRYPFLATNYTVEEIAYLDAYTLVK